MTAIIFATTLSVATAALTVAVTDQAKGTIAPGKQSVPSTETTPEPATVAPRTPLHQNAGHGVNRELMDPLVAPGDDFFRYANGRWLAQTPIPPDRDS